ncbi:putative magnesium transporter NIPA8 [Cytospora mali]|uniref:Magnesium transporter NIPA8 n=1 Tax=Cytospora mali TaxID=578113 RepID=A0A194VEZ2_CYTMA|nr:putative magnesium transporter NIPA8 [Valsa mali var. pyri (nom. inval.)]
MGSLGGMSPGGSIALGIIVGLLSTGVQSLGLTLQRKSHILEDEKGPHDIRRPPHRRRRWQVGMAMFIISNILGSSVQISTLPLPVLSTLQASGLVFNSICATLILGEPFTRWSLWGTLLVCSGAILIAIFGAIPSPTHTLNELLALLGRSAFVVWMALQAVLVIAICVVIDGVNHFLNLSQNPRFRLVRGLSYGCVSGILSAHSLLVAKSAVELIIKTLVDGKNQFVHWQAWVIVLALITLALTQLYYLHRGLKLVSTSVLYPLVFCIYNIIAILDGLIYFDQTELISTLHGCLIALGTAILLSGVLALSWRLSDEQHTPVGGQSSLAPGLGLVEDTEGEEEEEELLLAHATADAEGDVLPTTYTYNTFDSPEQDNVNRRSRPEPLPLIPATSSTGRKKASFKPLPHAPRWQERQEIWGELDDDELPYSPMPIGRVRSKTLPAEESSLLIGHRRGASEASASTDRLSQPPQSSRSEHRVRRKSTGFPGFTARKMNRRKSVGPGNAFQGAIGGFSKWWRSRTSNSSTGDLLARPPSSTLPEYRDDPMDRAAEAALARGFRDEPETEPEHGGGGQSSSEVTGRRRDDDSPV